MQRGISIITHFEYNNPKVYLSPVGNEAEMFPLALVSKIWTVFIVNKMTPSIKKFLSSPNTVLLHSGHRDFYLFKPQQDTWYLNYCKSMSNSLYAVSFHRILSLFAFFQTVYENWSVFTVTRWIQGLLLKTVTGMLYSASPFQK